jgi:hypothetical protein
VIGFLEELGLDATRAPYGDAHQPPALLTDASALCVCIFVLRTREQAEHWLKTHSATFELSNTILLVEASVASARVSVTLVEEERVLWLNDFIYLDLGRMTTPGPDGCGAYAGFAPMLLDHIGAKIGSAYLSALRKRLRAAA